MMKRFRLVQLLLMIAFCGIGPVDSRAQETVFVPVCTGKDNTAAFQTIIERAPANPRTIKIPYNSDLTRRCKLTTFLFPVNITLDNTDGSGSGRDAPNVVTVLGPVVNPAGKTLFFGSGTTSFAANTFAGTNGQTRLSNKAGVDTLDNPADATVSRLTIKPVPTF